MAGIFRLTACVGLSLAICTTTIAIAFADLLIVANGEDGVAPVVLSESDLDAFEPSEVITSNNYVDGKRRFVGPSFRSILSSLDLQPQYARLWAANDYSIEIEVSEILKYEAILAREIDGQKLSVRDKGPIWLIYPMDDYAELQDPAFNSRLIWQLVKIELW